mgnify:CR=1 FL=1
MSGRKRGHSFTITPQETISSAFIASLFVDGRELSPTLKPCTESRPPVKVPRLRGSILNREGAPLSRNNDEKCFLLFIFKKANAIPPRNKFEKCSFSRKDCDVAADTFIFVSGERGGYHVKGNSIGEEIEVIVVGA